MEIECIKRVEFRPGDRIVLRSSAILTIEQHDRISAQLQKFAPDVPHIILDPVFTLDVLATKVE